LLVATSLINDINKLGCSSYEVSNEKMPQGRILRDVLWRLLSISRGESTKYIHLVIGITMIGERYFLSTH
jgi:hypothetical protein